VSTPDFYTEATDYARRARAGVEVIGVDVQVLDDSGQPVPQDNATIGEVCARSNVVLEGLLEQPETDAATTMATL
jgi:acyl-CoA synthetase (AMP-forming)/AMP-acid ligase II